MRPNIAVSAALLGKFLVAALPNPPSEQSGHYSLSLDMMKRSDPRNIDARTPEKLMKRAQGSTGITSLSPMDEKWTVNLLVGGQSLPLVLDTGSQDIWFESNQEPASMTGSNHPLYTPQPSSSPISNLQWAAVFDSSPNPVAAGVAYSEAIVIGSVTVTNQIVGAATSVASPNNQRKSGMLGLSYALRQSNYGNASPAPASLMNNLYNQLRISQFTVDLRTDNSGRLDFGFIDQTKYQGSITYLDRDTGGNNWKVHLDDIYYVNGVRKTGTVSNHQIAGLTHVDTGAPKMNFPEPVVYSYYSTVPGASNATDGKWRFPCSIVKNKAMPSFGVSIKGVKFDVTNDWLWTTQSGATCVGALQPSSSSGPYNYSILGDPFLSTVFAVFDVIGPSGKGQVGFATKSLPVRPLPT